MSQSPDVGDKAPAFQLPTDGDEEISLKKLKGKKVVLFFYPRDDTPGCTKEAIGFTDKLSAFKRANTEIVGISKDTVEKHGKFRAKHNLKVVLGSDTEGDALNDYGVWVEKNMYGKKSMGIQRSTFLIDEKGIVRQVWRKVRVPGHVEEVLEAAKAL